MLRKTKVWDIRVPAAVLALFPKRTGYWYKVNRVQATLIVKALAKEYGVSAPVVDNVTPRDANGWYHPRGHRISVHARGHIKTTVHEFYHHLDEVTAGRYDSSDWPDHRLSHANERTTPVSLAWQFAEMWFDEFRRLYPQFHAVKQSNRNAKESTMSAKTASKSASKSSKSTAAKSVKSSDVITFAISTQSVKLFKVGEKPVEHTSRLR
jgi:hypothetical protein